MTGVVPGDSRSRLVMQKRRDSANAACGLAVDRPEDQPRRHADQDRGAERDEDPKILAPDRDVAGQPPQAQLPRQWMQDAGADEDDAANDQAPGHGRGRSGLG